MFKRDSVVTRTLVCSGPGCNLLFKRIANEPESNDEEFFNRAKVFGWIFSHTKGYRNRGDQWCSPGCRHQYEAAQKPEFSVVTLGDTFVVRKIKCHLCSDESGILCPTSSNIGGSFSTTGWRRLNSNGEPICPACVAKHKPEPIEKKAEQRKRTRRAPWTPDFGRRARSRTRWLTRKGNQNTRCRSSIDRRQP